MESNNLFVSPNGEYFINLYIDITVCKKENDALVFHKNLEKMKNPDTVCFSDDSALFAVKNNNNLVDVYRADSFTKIFKVKGPREFGGKMFFLDNERLLSSTESGKIYTLDIITGNMCCLYDLNLTYAEILQASNNRFFVFGNDLECTHIFLLSFDKRETSIKPIYSSKAKLRTNALSFADNRIYALFQSNEAVDLFVFRYGITDNTMKVEDCIRILTESDCAKLKKHASDKIFEQIYKIAPNVNIDFSPCISPLNITSTFQERFIIIAFNYMLAVFDVKEKKCVRRHALDAGIASFLLTDEGQHIWLSSGAGLKHDSINNITDNF